MLYYSHGKEIYQKETDSIRCILLLVRRWWMLQLQLQLTWVQKLQIFEGTEVWWARKAGKESKSKAEKGKLRLFLEKINKNYKKVIVFYKSYVILYSSKVKSLLIIIPFS